MNHLPLLAMAAILLFAFGCMNNSPEDLFGKYQKLEFNMSVDEIERVVGTPDIILPEIIGETWIWKDDHGIDRIVVYISPQKRMLTIDTGRLILKKWLEDTAGDS